MNLNDLARFRELDTLDMQSHIDRLPDQFEAAWAYGHTLPLPSTFSRIERIVIAGIGDEAVAGDMLAALVADSCTVPILVNRSYELPAYADGQSVLVIAISHEGNTEEVLSAVDLADARGTKLLAITTGGALAARIDKAGGTLWTYTYAGPSRTALGWSLGLLLSLVYRLGLVRDMAADVAEAVEFMRRNVQTLGVEAVVVKNPAKRLAGQMIGRTPLIYGAGLTAPVARRWKQQLNANGKTLAQWEELPELNHNSMAGMNYPAPLMTKIAIVFLVAVQSDHPRVALRWDLTRQLYLHEGLAADTVKARGHSPLAQMMSTVHYGDYMSYYVAMAYEVDPTPMPTVTDLHERLAAAASSTSA